MKAGGKKRKGETWVGWEKEFRNNPLGRDPTRIGQPGIFFKIFYMGATDTKKPSGAWISIAGTGGKTKGKKAGGVGAVGQTLACDVIFAKYIYLINYLYDIIVKI